MNTVEFYRDKAGEWRWRLKSSNGNIIAESGEGYKNKTDCEHGFSLISGESKKVYID